MKRVLLTAVAFLFGAAAFTQPSASVETLARKYADRDGALVMRLDSAMVGLVKLRVAALPDSLRRSAALLDKVSGMTNIMLMTGLARTLDPAADTTAFVRLESDFRADLAALTAEPARRRLFREREAGVEVALFQSNHEGAIVDAIQAAYGTVDGIIINPAGYTHTSVALRDAIAAVDIYLADATLAGLNEVSIIHGKGTGVLRTGIQRYLRTHMNVKKYRDGMYGEGEQGVTVVTLK